MATGENVLWIVEVTTCWRANSRAKHTREVFRTRVEANAHVAKIKATPYKGWMRIAHVHRATWGPAN